MIIALLSALAAATVGIAVLLANPQRFANQAFALLAFLTTGWLALVVIGLVATDPVPWARANAVVSALAPWGLWVIVSAIVTPNEPRRTLLWKSTPWLGIAALVMAVSAAPSFIQVGTAGEPPVRGAAYYIHVSILSISYLIVTLIVAGEMRRQRGIRRIEIQFLVLNLGVGCLLCVALALLGNVFGSNSIKLAGVLVLGISYVLTAWSIASHRIFNLRQVLTSIGQRAAIAVLLALSAFGLGLSTESSVPSHIVLLTSAVVCGFAAIWLDHKLRNWLGLDGDRWLTDLRTKVIEVARTEPQSNEIVTGLEELLRETCNTELALLMIEQGSAFSSTGLTLPRSRPAYWALLRSGWATPEALQRTRSMPERMDLREFLMNHSLGLVIAIPRGSQTPSLLIALGTKTNESPYTYPEITRLQNVAELMDNILTRSRLTTQAALKAKTEHLAMMSRGLAHDLKNLLTPVSSFLVHTEGRFPPDSPEAEVHGAAQRSVRMMGDYVREARFFSEQLTPHFERVSLQAVCDGVREATQARAAARNISIAMSVPVETYGLIDRVLVQRLLANLVANATDASSAGQTVAVSGELRHGRIRFQVKDQGCGIPAENLGRIFEAYFTTKEFGEDVRGFGLGLTICQKIAALHGGEISVESELGRGSTFTVDLPAAPPLATVNCVMLSSGAGI